NALCARGARFHHARREDGAICMADGYARVSGRLGICSVHQGPGLTNTVTGLTEAAKSRTPLLVLAGESPAAALTSNFRIDQPGLVESVGAAADRVQSPATAADDTQRAYHRALIERRPVVLMLPIDIQPQPPEALEPQQPPVPALQTPDPPQQALAAVADVLQSAQRPVIIAGRGAVLADAREELERLGALCGALLATSAPANGLFAGLPYALGISGGFASPFAAGVLPQADVVLAVGASLNHWTTRHGQLISDGARVAQIDVEARAFGLNRPADLTVLGDAAAAARLLADELERRGHRATGWRTPEMAADIAAKGWAGDSYEDASTEEWIDPRTLSIALEARLPAAKSVAVDSGHFLGYPAMFLSVPDARAWVFPNGFQSVGLGLGNAIGAAVARPDRLTVAAIGDGGAFMALAEIETAVRLGLKLLVLIYDDCAYGAEVHHFAPMGHDVSRVQFPDADLAALARAVGAEAATVRRTGDLDVVDAWLQDARPRPLVLDAKVNPTICAEWLAEAFRAG
ncbi:MAG TPA: thiamine pyrophosphate-dependent enzyme, partial [Solirubrobacteraceae bacterium]|nr:thiamine pyrophosphate-dependent enzyme [Solirubrobacteraceae bacterium]